MKLTFRIWIDGALTLNDSVARDAVEFHWLETIAANHAAVCKMAEDHGQVYLVEIDWGDGEFTRWGTDHDGMVIPLEVGLHDLAEAISKRWE